MERQYWLKREGKMYGPYSGGKLKKLAGEGKIGPNDLISTDRRAWQLAEMVRGLSLRATVKTPQTAATASTPSSLEVSPRTGTASRAHHQRPSSSRDEQRFPSRSSRYRWIAVGATGVALVGLAVAVSVWRWTPSGESMAASEQAQSNGDPPKDVRSSGKPEGARTTPTPAAPRGGSKPPEPRKQSPPTVTKPPNSHESPPKKETPKEKNVVAKKPVVTVGQFKAAAADFRTYMRDKGWPERTDLTSSIALALMYGSGDRYKQAKLRGPASLKNLFEQAEASRDVLRGRCFYLDVTYKNRWPVFAHNWSKEKATITVTTPFEARAGGDGLPMFSFRQCDDPQGVTMFFVGYHAFAALLKNGRLRTTSQYANGPISNAEAIGLAERGAVIYTRKQPYTCVDLKHVDVSAEQADRYGVRWGGGGLRARIYFTELQYAGPVGTHERLRRKIKYFRLDQVRRCGSIHLENTVFMQKATQPRVFLTTINDPVDYVSAKVVAIEVRTPKGAFLAKVDVGTKACSNLTPTSIAEQAAAVAQGRAAAGVNDGSVDPRDRSSTKTGSSSRRELVLDLGKDVDMKLVSIPAGRFAMGSSKSEVGRKSDESPRHSVMISKAFYMGVTEVTQTQYERVMGKNPSKFKGPQKPVECVSWHDATAFCTALSKKTGRAVRLPTEAEWEYACRSGTTTRFGFGDHDKDLSAYGWSKVDRGAETSLVGQKKPNQWGLYDMHGNVWEWCRDWYDAKFYARRRNVNPENTTEAKYRVLRGGSRISTPVSCRSASRNKYFSSSRNNNLGFRVVITSG